MIADEQRRFLDAHRVARLATADADGRPHVVPVCYALADDSLYFTIDEKPKRSGARLKRLSNIRQNPYVALVVDRYDEDWSRLGWVMVQGRADILESCDEHDRAQSRLHARYRQLREMRIGHLPVVAIRIERTIGWGDLSPA